MTIHKSTLFCLKILFPKVCIIAFIAFNLPFSKNKILCSHLKKICQKIIFNKSIWIQSLLSLRCGGAYESQPKWTLIGIYIVTKIKIKISIFTLKLYVCVYAKTVSACCIYIFVHTYTYLWVFNNNKKEKEAIKLRRWHRMVWKEGTWKELGKKKKEGSNVILCWF